MFGVLALALAMSGVPALALAESNGGQSSGDEQKQEVAGQGDRSEVKGSNERNGEDQEVKEPAELQEPQEEQESIELEDENDTAVSLDDLKQKIENRKQELDNEEASTTPKFKDAMKNANEVRLAVHALLASKDLIGGIGQQVSEIAKEMNRSVASTTNAEAKVQARGFLMRLLFGGDRTSAEIIAQEASQNQQRIDGLTALLGQANIPADIQAILSEQITALQTAQARLQALADKEKNAWGLFSWRF